jgi:hypothetical protein
MARARFVIQLDSLSVSLAYYLRRVKLFCNPFIISTIENFYAVGACFPDNNAGL